MGLPQIIIAFTTAAQTAVQRSQEGIVALILRDDTKPSTNVPEWTATTAYTVGEYVIPANGANGWFYECTTAGTSGGTAPTWPTTSGQTVTDGTVTWTTVKSYAVQTYNTIDDVSSSDWTASNYDLLSKTFLGTPSKVIVARGATADTDYTAQLSNLSTMRWNYLAVPQIATADVDTLSTWIITQRGAPNRKTYKAVLPNSASDNEGIINFTTDNITVGTTIYTTTEYTARIAGILAGLPQTRSSTYYVLPEVDSITQSADPDTDIDAGKLIFINDGEKVKIARGVNSLQTLTGKSADWQKIKIIDGHDQVQDDIQNTFADEYVGQVDNDYDNQLIFITAANQYLKQLQGTVLDPNGTNTISIDVQAQRQAWQNAGTDTSSWSDQKVKETSFQSNVFLDGSAKFMDAMEDMQLNMTV